MTKTKYTDEQLIEALESCIKAYSLRIQAMGHHEPTRQHWQDERDKLEELLERVKQGR